EENHHHYSTTESSECQYFNNSKRDDINFCNCKQQQDNKYRSFNFETDLDSSFNNFDDELLNQLAPALHSIGLSPCGHPTTPEMPADSQCHCGQSDISGNANADGLSSSVCRQQILCSRSCSSSSSSGIASISSIADDSASALSSSLSAATRRRLSHDRPAPAGPTVAAVAAAALLNEVAQRRRRTSASSIDSLNFTAAAGDAAPPSRTSLLLTPRAPWPPQLHRSHSASCQISCYSSASTEPDAAATSSANQLTAAVSASCGSASWQVGAEEDWRLANEQLCQPLLPAVSATDGRPADGRFGICEISPETLASALTGKLDSTLDGHSLVIVDCRFPYEWSAGRVKGAINIYMPDQLLEMMFEQRMQSQVVLVFYCEFSSERAPRLAGLLRGSDRQRSLLQGIYPSLLYPQLCLLRGGYRAFNSDWPDLCQPSGYVKMSEPAYAAECASCVSQLNAWERMKHQQRRRQFRRRRLVRNLSDCSMD
ncbi:hypothetical protein BOX15_Mlig020736g1, partial [Macrostomum lignano]